MSNRFGLPHLGFGLGLRAPHYNDVLRDRPKVDWFEVISENVIDAHQGYREFLGDLRRDYPFVMHGVSLSIGSTDALDRGYLTKLKAMANFLQPAWVSDHLCFTGVLGTNSHDLLPIPYTEEALNHIAGRVRQVQDMLERPLILENPSSYVAFAGSTLPEPQFLSALAGETGCGLLLDVNNVYVSAFNHGLDAKAYIDTIPTEHIVQIHLAGHKDCGAYRVDTHDREVPDAVWQLYGYTLKTKGAISTMIEWDEQIPPFQTLFDEMEKAKAAAQHSLSEAA